MDDTREFWKTKRFQGAAIALIALVLVVFEIDVGQVVGWTEAQLEAWAIAVGVLWGFYGGAVAKARMVLKK